MPEVIFPGPEGRLEGRYSPGPRPRAPVAMILHPHSQGGGTMNDRIVQRLYKTFVDRGFATLRFNFRGVGRSQGSFDNGIGELSDAAAALDWVQSIHPESQTTWVAGVSFGALIGMQLLMRRPEIRGFISIAPPANMYDFSFLAPCPASGIFIQGGTGRSRAVRDPVDVAALGVDISALIRTGADRFCGGAALPRGYQSGARLAVTPANPPSSP